MSAAVTRRGVAVRIGRAIVPIASPRSIALVALLAAVSLGPRVPLPISVPGRQFELRIEDLLLVVFAPIALANAWRIPHRFYPVLFAMVAYLAIGLIGIVGNAWIYGLDAFRAALYWTKDLEYFLFFFIAANWLRNEADRGLVVRAFIAFALLNAGWVAAQLLVGFHRELFRITPWFDAYRQPWQFGGVSYGPGLIGEISPLSTGTFFLLAFLVAFSRFVLGGGGRSQWRRFAIVAIFLAPVFHSQSRVSILGTLIGALIIAAATRNYRVSAMGFTGAFAIAVLTLILSGSIGTSAERFGRLPFSLAERFGIYERALEATPSPVPSSPTVAVAPTVPPSVPFAVTPPARGLPSGTAPLASLPVALPSVPPSSAAPALVLPALGAPPEADPGTRAFWAIVGFGKGSPGVIPGVPAELHNHYLRSLIETGAAGLVAFAGLLALITRLAWRRWLSARGALPVVVVAAFLVYAVAASFQDMFLPVLPNELLWLLAGAAVSDDRGAPS